MDKNAKRYFEDNAETTERIIFTKTIGPDYFYLQYDVKVGTYNDHGDGPNSTAAIIYSAEGSMCSIYYVNTPMQRSNSNNR